MIRVGRKTDNSVPTYSGFTPVLSLTSSTKYFSLSPYYLKNEVNINGESVMVLLENQWQFSKLYEKVLKSTQRYSRWNQRIIWDHPAEVHIKDGVVTESYFQWRQKGFRCKDPVRYPVTYNYRHKCLWSLKEDPAVENGYTFLNYIEARKQIYLPLYLEAVKKESQFQDLLRRYRQGENLLIIEVDGPHQGSLNYYKEKYKVNDDFIDRSTILATSDNLHIMLNDDKHPFGHGYCLAWALLELP